MKLSESLILQFTDIIKAIEQQNKSHLILCLQPIVPQRTISFRISTTPRKINLMTKKKQLFIAMHQVDFSSIEMLKIKQLAKF